MLRPSIFKYALCFSLVACSVFAAGCAARGEEAGKVPPGEDAAPLYFKASGLAKVDSPALTSMEWDHFQPLPAEWRRVAEEAWKANGPAFALAREARSLKRATWPSGKEETKVPMFNPARRVASQLGDAALYHHLLGDDAASVELIRDTMHLADLLRDNPPGNSLIPPLVGAGIDALAMSRLQQIVADVKLTAEAGKPRELQVGEARKIIEELLAGQREPEELITKSLGGEAAAAYRATDPAAANRFVEQIHRTNMGRAHAAMALACHLYRFDNKRWPASLGEFVPKYLPSVPVDPWGDGKQTYGYLLVKNGLPDGGDRPLVYARCTGKDGLAYRTDGPQYDFYNDDGSTRSRAQQLQTGQFRDVARWSPTTSRKHDEVPQVQSIEAGKAGGV